MRRRHQGIAPVIALLLGMIIYTSLGSLFMFSRCQRLVQKVHSSGQRGSEQERKLCSNITASMARTLQEMSTNFRRSQSSYLRKIQTREERSRQYFDTNIGPQSGAVLEEVSLLEDSSYDRGFSSGQLQLVEENEQLVKQREKEITHIVQSIQDLNEIFKDLSTMIVDQGTILDRIDYNIESAGTHVEKGLQQLKKAEKYQKKNRKMYCILILALVIIVLIIILIGVKS